MNSSNPISAVQQSQRFSHFAVLPLLLLLTVGPQASPRAHAQAARAPAAAAENPVAKAAREQGVRSCLQRISQTSNGLMQGAAAAGAVVFPAGEMPDRQIFSNSFELLQASSLSYVSMNYAPDGVACNFSYETVQFWNVNCQQTAAESFKGAKPVGLMKQQINVLEISPSARVFLMPAGNGCVSIKKQVVHPRQHAAGR